MKIVPTYTPCPHTLPESFTDKEVIWEDSDHSIGTLVLACLGCFEYMEWTVTN